MDSGAPQFASVSPNRSGSSGPSTCNDHLIQLQSGDSHASAGAGHTAHLSEAAKNLQMLREPFGDEATLCAAILLYDSCQKAQQSHQQSGIGSTLKKSKSATGSMGAPMDSSLGSLPDDTQVGDEKGQDDAASSSGVPAAIVLTDSMMYVVTFGGKKSSMSNEEQDAAGASPKDNGDDDGGFTFDVKMEDVVESIMNLTIFVAQEEAVAAATNTLDPIFELKTFSGKLCFKLDRSCGESNESLETVIHAIGSLPAVALDQKDVSEIEQDEVLLDRAFSTTAFQPPPSASAATLEPDFDTIEVAEGADEDLDVDLGEKSSDTPDNIAASPNPPRPPAASPPSTALSSMSTSGTPSVSVAGGNNIASADGTRTAADIDEISRRSRTNSAFNAVSRSRTSSLAPAGVAGGSVSAYDRLQQEASAIETQLQAEKDRLRSMFSQSLQTSTVECCLQEEERRRTIIEDEAAKRCNIYLVLYSSTVHLVERTMQRQLEEVKSVYANTAVFIPEVLQQTTNTTQQHQDGVQAGNNGEDEGPLGANTTPVMDPQSVGMIRPDNEEAQNLIEAHERQVRTKLSKYLTTTQRQLAERRQRMEREMASASFIASERQWRGEKHELQDRIKELESQLHHTQENNKYLSTQLTDLKSREEAVLERARKRENDLHAEVHQLRDSLSRAASVQPQQQSPASSGGGGGAFASGNTRSTLDLDDDESTPQPAQRSRANTNFNNHDEQLNLVGVRQRGMSHPANFKQAHHHVDGNDGAAAAPVGGSVPPGGMMMTQGNNGGMAFNYFS